MLQLETTVCGLFRSNIYLLYDDETLNAVIIDCGGKLEDIKKIVKQRKLTVTHLILTHGHFDHIEALEEFMKEFSPQLIVNSFDVPFLQNPAYNLSERFSRKLFNYSKKVDIEISGDCTIKILDRLAKFIHTPGHTPGSMCFLIDDMLFTGDTLFYDNIGNTNLPLGDQEAELCSIKTKLLCLADDTVVYPGHGAPTTIGREKKSNMYLE